MYDDERGVLPSGFAPLGKASDSDWRRGWGAENRNFLNESRLLGRPACSLNALTDSAIPRLNVKGWLARNDFVRFQEVSWYYNHTCEITERRHWADNFLINPSELQLVHFFRRLLIINKPFILNTSRELRWTVKRWRGNAFWLITEHSRYSTGILFYYIKTSFQVSSHSTQVLRPNATLVQLLVCIVFGLKAYMLK
jgi:hypothetical protein